MAEETHPGFRDEPDLVTWWEQGLWDELGVLPVVVRPNPAVTTQSPRIHLVDYDPWILEKLGRRLIAWGLAVCCEATITRYDRVLAHDPPWSSWMPGCWAGGAWPSWRKPGAVTRS